MPDTNPLNDQPTLGLPGSDTPTKAKVGEVFGDYVLLVEVGRGGMGVVFKAFEPALNRHVAIKMILPGALADNEELARFHIEASAAGRLQHSHIVKVHRVGCCNGQHFFSMDYIEGPSLAQRLAGGPLPGKDAARYLVAIARAIHHAHQQGILHRDIKPGNILIDANDQPHVTDFGLAKQMSADNGQTRTGAVLGTPSYMAPEQASGRRDLTPATDVYGLGALLYELLTAKPPFKGENALETILLAMESDPAPPRLLNPRLDRDLETICLKCLSKEPHNRYQSAEELANDLQRYLNGESIQARSLNIFDYLSRSLDRSQYDIEFRPYSVALFWFAGIVGVMHIIKHLLIVNHAAMEWIMATHSLQFVLMLVVMWLNRPKGLMPTSPAERLLWSVWTGYVITCVATSMLIRLMVPDEEVYRGILYPPFCAITGMAFWILGSSYWGKLYIVAAAFFGLGFLLLLNRYWGALGFGGLWTVTLVLIGLRLRHLGQSAR